MLIVIAAALIFTALLCLLTLKWAIWIALTTITFTLFLPLILFALLAVAGGIGYFIYRRRRNFSSFKFNKLRFLNHRSQK